ncbi:MAG: hypothetical protein ACRBCT_02095 [Alphaproteobacteria bacterium]
MLHFIPTFGSRKVAQETNQFLRDNRATFWRIFLPLTPYIAALTTLDTLLTHFAMPEGKSFTYGKLASYYFIACLTISWLRINISGKENLTTANPLKPTKSELTFMATALGIFSLPILITTIMPFITANTSSIITSLLLGFMASFILSLIASYKFAFYFPALANGHDLTIPAAFKLTKGYVEKTISTTIRTAFKHLLKTLTFLATITIAKFILGHSKTENPLIPFLYDLITSLTLALYFIPLLIITALSVLSHYYQDARAKGAPQT